MIVTNSTNVLQSSFADMWLVVAQALPAIVAAVIIFIIGWVVGAVLYRIVVEVCKVLRLDVALRAAGFDDAAKEMGFTLDIGKFLGVLVQWFVTIIFLVAALDVLGLNRVTVFLEQVVLFYLPQVIVAVLILVLAAVVAEVVKGLVSGSIRATGAHSANLAGSIAKWAIWIIAIVAALTQLGIAPVLLQTLFTGIVAGASLAFGLAFGLGGKDAAARTIENIRSEIAHRR
jgi:hypothetical protein